MDHTTRRAHPRRPASSLAVAWLLTLLSLASAGAAESTRMAGAGPTARLEATGPESQPAGLPILVQLKLVNTGRVPFSFPSGGPGNYPGAWQFAATIIDDQGRSHDAEIANGQYQSWRASVLRIIGPGETMDVPVAVTAPPPGQYTLIFSIREKSFEGSSPTPVTGRPGERMAVAYVPATAAKPLLVSVTQDPQAQSRWQQDLLVRVRTGDPFARDVASHFKIEPVIAALVPDLDSDDPNASYSASQTLYVVEPLPSGTAGVINRAIHRYFDQLQPFKAQGALSDKESQPYLDALCYLSALAGHVGTDEALDSVLLLARTHPFADERNNDQMRYEAVAALGTFPQPGARKALAEFLKDKSQLVREAAKNAIAYPRSPKHAQ